MKAVVVRSIAEGLGPEARALSTTEATGAIIAGTAGEEILRARILVLPPLAIFEDFVPANDFQINIYGEVSSHRSYRIAA